MRSTDEPSAHFTCFAGFVHDVSGPRKTNILIEITIVIYNIEDAQITSMKYSLNAEQVEV